MEHQGGQGHLQRGQWDELEFHQLSHSTTPVNSLWCTQTYTHTHLFVLQLCLPDHHTHYHATSILNGPPLVVLCSLWPDAVAESWFVSVKHACFFITLSLNCFHLVMRVPNRVQVLRASAGHTPWPDTASSTFKSI